MARNASNRPASAGQAPKPGEIAKHWAQGKLPRVVMVIGAERALREEALDGIRKAAFTDGDGGLSWVVIHASGEKGAVDAQAVTPAQVLDEVCTSSLFGGSNEPKIVVLRQAELLLNLPKRDEGHPRDVFERNLSKIPQDAVLVFEVGQAGQLKNTRLYKAIAESGAAVLCDPLRSAWGLDGPDTELAQEIERRGRALDLALSPGAAAALIARSGQDLGVLEEELGKLAISLEGKPGEKVQVREEDIERICANTRLVGAFEFVDALAERDSKRALETLGAIFAHGLADHTKPGSVVSSEGSIAMRLLGALSWRLTQLQDIQASLEAGKREFEVFAAAKVFGPRQDVMRRTLRKHTSASLRRSMEALLRVNLELRTNHDRRTSLEQMALKICKG